MVKSEFKVYGDNKIFEDDGRIYYSHHNPYDLLGTIYKSVEDMLNKTSEKEKETEETGNMPYKESVNHPSHYGGKDNPYETIKVIDAWGLDFELGNAIKYISRAGKKDPTKIVEDLKKAIFYIQHEIDKIEAGKRV